MKFTDFEFDHELEDALYYMKFEEPTPIQQQAIPIIQKKHDLIACAQTGTGKTAAYLLPLIDRQSKGELPTDKNHTLIVVPTRELALQIDQQMEAFSYFSGASSIAIYGGGAASDFEQQKKALKKGAGFIIATPGRLLSHMRLGYVNFNHIQHFVLDEADRMLDMGFSEDIEEIAAKLPKDRQNLMFSATMPPRIRKLADKTLKDPKTVNIALSKPAEGVLQAAYIVYQPQKLDLLVHLLKGKENYQSILIFSGTKKGTTDITRYLKRKGFQAAAMSSDLEQSNREVVLREFASRKLQILVATDILSRGIDIKEINLVVNYDVPQDAADYVHRVGRTARADATGVALTFVSERDQRDFKDIETLIESEIKKLPLPVELGEGPAYEPNKRRGGRGRGGHSSGGRRSSGRGGGRSGGNKRGGNRRSSNKNSGERGRRNNNDKSK